MAASYCTAFALHWWEICNIKRPAEDCMLDRRRTSLTSQDLGEHTVYRSLKECVMVSRYSETQLTRPRITCKLA